DTGVQHGPEAPPPPAAAATEKPAYTPKDVQKDLNGRLGPHLSTDAVNSLHKGLGRVIDTLADHPDQKTVGRLRDAHAALGQVSAAMSAHQAEDSHNHAEANKYPAALANAKQQVMADYQKKGDA